MDHKLLEPYKRGGGSYVLSKRTWDLIWGHRFFVCVPHSMIEGRLSSKDDDWRRVVVILTS